MTVQYNVAVVGATGAIGEALLEFLAEREFPIADIYPVEAVCESGDTALFGKKSVAVEALADFDFSRIQLAFFATEEDVSAEFAPIAAEAGALVIDNSAAFSNDPDVPLIIPEVNGEEIAAYVSRNMVASPRSSVVQLCMALKPIHDEVGVDRVNVTTYQSVSGSGKSGVNELAGQTAKLLNGHPAEPELYPARIAFNAIPQVGELTESGHTTEEIALVRETQKVLADYSLRVSPSCVRVPVFYADAESVHVETHTPITVDEVRALLEAAPGIELCGEPDGTGYPTQTIDGVGKDSVLVGRVRQDLCSDNGLDLWIVSDNLRKGTALNAVQIAEMLIESYI